jgi:protein-S-isoprenylcysteine O-methyltransferase Ste14
MSTRMALINYLLFRDGGFYYTSGRQTQGGTMTEAGPGKIAFVVFMALAVAWRVWETFRKQGTERGSVQMAWSFYALFALSCVIFGGTVAEFFLVERALQPGLSALGVCLFVAANLLRVSAIRALGKYWSLHVEVRERHPFIRSGPYRYVRHPAYLSFVVEHVAVPLVANAWWSLGVAVLVYVPMVVLRMRVEERALVAKFGQAYCAYQREVGALWPKGLLSWRKPGAADGVG